MAKVTGIIPCCFSASSDLFANDRNILVHIDSFSVPLYIVLDKLFTINKNVAAPILTQHEILVFGTDTVDTPIWPTPSAASSMSTEAVEQLKTDLRNQRALKRDVVIKNYSHLEIVCIKLSVEKQRQRDAVEEEELLLTNVDEAAKKTTKPVSVSTSKTTAADEFRRKATLCSLKLPLHLSSETISSKLAALSSSSSSSSSSTTVKNCLLCKSSLRPSKSSQKQQTSSSSSMSLLCGNISCKKLCCNQCYDYCFNLRLVGRCCPVCGLNEPSTSSDVTINNVVEKEETKTATTTSETGPSASAVSFSEKKKENEEEGEQNQNQEHKKENEEEMNTSVEKVRRIEN